MGIWAWWWVAGRLTGHRVLGEEIQTDAKASYNLAHPAYSQDVHYTATTRPSPCTHVYIHRRAPAFCRRLALSPQKQQQRWMRAAPAGGTCLPRSAAWLQVPGQTHNPGAALSAPAHCAVTSPCVRAWRRGRAQGMCVRHLLLPGCAHQLPLCACRHGHGRIAADQMGACRCRQSPNAAMQARTSRCSHRHIAAEQARVHRRHRLAKQQQCACCRAHL